MPEAHVEARLAVHDTKIDAQDKHTDRLDASMEKLTEVSISLKEIVKNHETQLATRAQETRDINTILEERRQHVDSALGQVKAEITATKNDFDNGMRELKTSFDTALKVVTDQMTTSNGIFQKYKYLMLGGGAIIFFLIDKLNVIENIFNLPIVN